MGRFVAIRGEPQVEVIWRALFFTAADTSAISACPAELGLHGGHHLAHVSSTGGAPQFGAHSGNARRDLGVDLRCAQALRQVGLRARELGALFLDQVEAVAGAELRDRVLALLDQLVDDRDHIRVGQDDALVDLALFQRGEQAADREQPRRVFGAHRGLHVFRDPVFDEAHSRLPGLSGPETTKPARRGLGVGKCRAASADPKAVRTAFLATACCERA